MLTYRGNPLSGGQGVYVRNLSRELRQLGHDVTVISGPPYPDLDERALAFGRFEQLRTAGSLRILRRLSDSRRQVSARGTR